MALSSCEGFREDMTFDADAQQCDEEEHQQLAVLARQGRIYHYGHRTVFNDEHVSIMIKNMPSQGTRSYDALLDMAAKLIPAINGRYIAICEHLSLLQTRESLMTILHQISADVTLLANEKTLLSLKISEAIKDEFSQTVHTKEHLNTLVSLVENENYKPQR